MSIGMHARQGAGELPGASLPGSIHRVRSERRHDRGRRGVDEQVDELGRVAGPPENRVAAQILIVECDQHQARASTRVIAPVQVRAASIRDEVEARGSGLPESIEALVESRDGGHLDVAGLGAPTAAAPPERGAGCRGGEVSPAAAAAMHTDKRAEVKRSNEHPQLVGDADMNAAPRVATPHAGVVARGVEREVELRLDVRIRVRLSMPQQASRLDPRVDGGVRTGMGDEDFTADIHVAAELHDGADDLAIGFHDGVCFQGTGMALHLPAQVFDGRHVDVDCRPARKRGLEQRDHRLEIRVRRGAKGRIQLVHVISSAERRLAVVGHIGTLPRRRATVEGDLRVWRADDLIA